MRLFRRSSAGRQEPLDTRPPSRNNDDDNLILSFPKSGRTWLSYLYAYYACYRILDTSADAFIDRELTPTAHIYRPLEHPALLALLQTSEGAVVPPLRLGHYFEPTPYFQLNLALEKVGGRRVGYLARDPRDVVVSYFHHTTQRADDSAGARKNRPAADVDLSEFLRSETHGIRAVVAYMNQVIERGPNTFEQFRMWHYEDLLASPEIFFVEVLDLFNAAVNRSAVASAVARASFANLQRIEIQRRTRKAAAPPSADALRFRRGVAGAYRTELSASDIAYLDAVIARHLNPKFARYRAGAACLA